MITSQDYSFGQKYAYTGLNRDQDLMTRVQTKVLGKMANKNSIKFVVDENVAAVLDDFHKWAKV